MSKGILAIALWGFFGLGSVAYAQSAQEWAVQGMQPQREMISQDRRKAHAPMDIRSDNQLLAVAMQDIGKGRFTPWQRAWCADALNAWLRRAGYRGTGDGRAIAFARWGRASGPKVGAIAVMRHHVGIVARRVPKGVILLSGNHSRRVGLGTYAYGRIIAFREPT